MRLLLIQFCTVFSIVAFSQAPNKNNKVTIAGFPEASSYSIQLRYPDGEITPMGNVTTYVESMFPQVKNLKMVDKEGDVTIYFVPLDAMLMQDARNDDRYAPQVNRYERYWPLPKFMEQNQVGYFRPFTINVEHKGKLLYTVETIGQFHSTGSDRAVAHFRNKLTQKREVASNIRFFYNHFYQLLVD